MKSIDGIKIIQVDGLNRGATAGDVAAGGANGETGGTSVICRAHLSYPAPLIDSLLNEIGIAGGSLKALTTPLVSSATDEINREATVKEQ